MTSVVSRTSAAPDTDRFRTQLRQAGLRVTEPRLAVLSALTSQPHSGADAIFQLVRAELPGTSVQAVYNVLGDLTRAAILRRIEPAGSVSLYELCIGDNHHHLVCTNCRQIRDVKCEPASAPCLQPGQDHGFQISEAEVTFWGLCASCAKTDSQP